MTVGDVRLKLESKAVAFTEWELKALRRVRTAAGAARYKLPIGSVIVGGAGSKGRKLVHLKISPKPVEGFDEITSASGGKKDKYYIGKFAGEKHAVVLDANDEVLHEGTTPEAAFEWLDDYIGKASRASAKKPTSRRGAPKPDNYVPAGKKPTTRNGKPVPKTPKLSRSSDLNAVPIGGMSRNHSGKFKWEKRLVSENRRIDDSALIARYEATNAMLKEGTASNPAEWEHEAWLIEQEIQRRIIAQNRKGSEMAIDYKTVSVRGFKDLGDSEDGVVEALVAVTGIRDNVNDIILPGAFEKSLITRNPKGVWHHNITESVSRTEGVKELPPLDPQLPATLPNGEPWPKEAGGLLVKTRFNLATSRGRDAYEDVKFFGEDQEWSIGYNVPTGGATIDRKTGVRMINTLELYEYSPVLFGAMPNARTTSVKSAQVGWKQLNGVDEAELKTLLDELAEEKEFEQKTAILDLDLETKSAKPNAKAGEEDEEDPDAETSEEDEEDPDAETEEEDEEEDEEKSFVIDFTKVDAVENAIDALTTLRDMMVKSAVNETKEDGSTSLSDLADAAGLDCKDAATAFDSAVKDGDMTAMEEAGSTVLDAVESAQDSEDADTDALKKVTAKVASAFQSAEADGATEDEDESEPTETKKPEEKSEMLQLDTKSFAAAFED